MPSSKGYGNRSLSVFPSRPLAVASAMEQKLEALKYALPDLQDNQYDVVWMTGELGLQFEQDDTSRLPIVSKITASEISDDIKVGDVLIYINSIKAERYTFSRFFQILSSMKKPVLMRFQSPQVVKSSVKRSNILQNRLMGATAAIKRRSPSREQFISFVRGRNADETEAHDLSPTDRGRSGSLMDRVSDGLRNSGVLARLSRSSTSDSTMLQKSQSDGTLPIKVRRSTVADTTELHRVSDGGSITSSGSYGLEYGSETGSSPRTSSIRTSSTLSSSTNLDLAAEDNPARTKEEEEGVYTVTWSEGQLGLIFAAADTTEWPMVTRRSPDSMFHQVSAGDYILSANGTSSEDYEFEEFFGILAHMKKPISLQFLRKVYRESRSDDEESEFSLADSDSEDEQVDLAADADMVAPIPMKLSLLRADQDTLSELTEDEDDSDDDDVLSEQTEEEDSDDDVLSEYADDDEDSDEDSDEDEEDEDDDDEIPDEIIKIDCLPPSLRNSGPKKVPPKLMSPPSTSIQKRKSHRVPYERAEKPPITAVSSNDIKTRVNSIKALAKESAQLLNGTSDDAIRVRRRNFHEKRPVMALPSIPETSSTIVPIPKNKSQPVVKNRGKIKLNKGRTPDSTTYVIKWRESHGMGISLREMRLSRGVFPLVQSVCRDKCCASLGHILVGDVVLELNGKSVQNLGVKRTQEFLESKGKNIQIRLKHGPLYSSQRISAA